MAAEPNYTYKAEFVRAKDGDTYELLLDFGKFSGAQVKAVVDIRLNGIDTWELHDDARGTDAQAAAEEYLLEARRITVSTYKPSGVPIGKTFERTKADVYVDGESMVTLMWPHRKQ